MPWRLEARDGKVCVIKESDGSVAGCHDSRADAIKQQRALYANESRMASIYAELDSEEGMVSEEISEQPASTGPETPSSELVRIEIGKENEVLTASVLGQMERMSERQAQTDQALIAALHAIGLQKPVVNVAAPEVSVEAPNVTVEPPAVTVEAPNVTVEATEVTVHPEIHLPASQKTVTFERDPLTREVTKAEVVEG